MTLIFCVNEYADSSQRPGMSSMSEGPVSSSGVDVVIDALGKSGTPKCPHGPTLLFERYVGGERRRFYACSACRDRKGCSFFQWANQRLSKKKLKARDKIVKEQQKSAFTCVQHKQRFRQFCQLPVSQRVMCRDCGDILLPAEVKGHNGHNLITMVTKASLRRPTSLLPPLDNNKTNAQYLFSTDTVDFLVKSLERLGFTRVLCVGTPRIHEEIMCRRREKVTSLRSFLLDIDHRLEQFFPRTEFTRYNMFNHHFFHGQKSKARYVKFVCDTEGSLAVILDPPFGGMVDILSHTVKTIWADCQSGQDKSRKPPEFLWVFPYFMEPRIQAACPQLSMLDHKVLYDNHATYRKESKPKTEGSLDSSRSNKGSPVRIFTTIKPSLFVLPADKYRFCEPCQRYTFKETQHCPQCDSCTSKDGRQYRHCTPCERCVKPSWNHCQMCDKCHLQSYNCQQPRLGCHVCGGEGHKRRECPQVERRHQGTGRKRKTMNSEAPNVKKKKKH